jgi:hypothetical protein
MLNMSMIIVIIESDILRVNRDPFQNLNYCTPVWLLVFHLSFWPASTFRNDWQTQITTLDKQSRNQFTKPVSTLRTNPIHRADIGFQKSKVHGNIPQLQSAHQHPFVQQIKEAEQYRWQHVPRIFCQEVSGRCICSHAADISSWATRTGSKGRPLHNWRWSSLNQNGSLILILWELYFQIHIKRSLIVHNNTDQSNVAS